MFKNYFEGIENIEVGPLISLAIFFIFFIVLLIYTYKMDKGSVEKMKNMPLEDGDAKTDNTN